MYFLKYMTRHVAIHQKMTREYTLNVISSWHVAKSYLSNKYLLGEVPRVKHPRVNEYAIYELSDEEAYDCQHVVRKHGLEQRLDVGMARQIELTRA